MMTSFLWDYSPYLVETDFFSIRYYSLFFGLGIFFVWLRSVKELSDTIEKEVLENSLFNMILFMLIGSRLFHCFLYEFDYYSRNLLEVLLPIRLYPIEITGFQGLSSHGGFIGLVIYLFFILKRKVSKIQLNKQKQRLERSIENDKNRILAEFESEKQKLNLQFESVSKNSTVLSSNVISSRLQSKPKGQQYNSTNLEPFIISPSVKRLFQFDDEEPEN